MAIREAAGRYGVSQRTLQERLRRGEISGHKARGPHGREWRVNAADMEAFGYQLPEQRQEPPPVRNDDVEDLRRTVARLSGDVAHYRRQADEADRQLGEAVREIARLRAEAGQGPALRSGRASPALAR